MAFCFSSFPSSQPKKSIQQLRITHVSPLMATLRIDASPLHLQKPSICPKTKKRAAPLVPNPLAPFASAKLPL
eukprot:1107708-Pelagomonas_calceolata.AAC.1